MCLHRFTKNGRRRIYGHCSLVKRGLVTSAFRVKFVRVKRPGPGPAKQAQAYSAASADKAANESTGTCRNTDVDQITVASIETWPLGNVTGGAIARRSTISSRCACAFVTPMPRTRMSLSGERNPKREHKEHQRHYQKLFHSRKNLPCTSLEESLLKFLERVCGLGCLQYSSLTSR